MEKKEREKIKASFFSPSSKMPMCTVVDLVCDGVALTRPLLNFELVLVEMFAASVSSTSANELLCNSNRRFSGVCLDCFKRLVSAWRGRKDVMWA